MFELCLSEVVLSAAVQMFMACCLTYRVCPCPYHVCQVLAVKMPTAISYGVAIAKRKTIKDTAHVITEGDAAMASKRMRQMSSPTEGQFALTGGDAFREGAVSSVLCQDSEQSTFFSDFMELGFAHPEHTPGITYCQ